MNVICRLVHCSKHYRWQSLKRGSVWRLFANCSPVKYLHGQWPSAFSCHSLVCRVGRQLSAVLTSAISYYFHSVLLDDSDIGCSHWITCWFLIFISIHFPKESFGRWRKNNVLCVIVADWHQCISSIRYFVTIKCTTEGHRGVRKLVSIIALEHGLSEEGWCSTKYLAVPNNFHLRHCACVISQSLVRRCLFISYLFLRLWLRLGLIIPACRANLVLRVIWQCDIFGMTPA